MARSQAVRNAWSYFLRKMLTSLLPFIGLGAGFFGSREFLDLDLDTSFGVGLGAGAVFLGIGLYLRRLVPKPGAGAGAVGTAAVVSSAVSDLLDD